MKILYPILPLLFFFSMPVYPLSGIPAGGDGFAVVDSSEGLYILDRKWHFKPHDDPAYKDTNIDLSSWELVYPHMNRLRDERFSLYDGNAWFRIEIFIVSVNGPLALCVGIHHPGAQFYWNGSLIYESRPFAENGLSPPIPGKPDVILIPDDLIVAGKNVLAIRSSTLDFRSGFNNPLYIGSFNRINKFFLRRAVLYFSLGFICVFIAIYFLFLYINRREEKYYLFYSIYSFSLFSWFLGYHGYLLFIADYKWTYDVFTYLGSLLLPLTIINFLHSFLNLPATLIKRAFEAFYAIIGAFIIVELAVTGGVYLFHRYIYFYYIYATVGLIAYSIYLGIRGMLKKRPFARFILCGVSVMAIPALIGMLDYLNIYSVNPPLLEAYFVMTLIFAAALARRYAGVYSDLENANRSLMEFDRMKDNFLSTTTHELRTPLHGIMGIAKSMLDESADLNDIQRDQLNLIQGSAFRLNKLVTDILDFSKLRAGRIELMLATVSLEDIIASAVSLVKVTVKDKEIDVLTEIPHLPPVKADEDRIGQVLLNLMGNAVKFTEKGTITVRAWLHDDAVAVSIADTGIGIDMDDLERIWAPFEQGGDPDIRVSGGTGLGLAISKEIIEMHGGSISVSSIKNRGTSITFLLPVELPGQDPKAERRGEIPDIGMPEADFATHQKTNYETQRYQFLPFPETIPKSPAMILAVDDDHINISIIENLCNTAGYTMLTARTGQEALEVLEKRDIDLILLDLMLPGMSGFEICHRIRSSRGDEYLPVIMITVRDRLQDQVKGFISGANDYITKPFDGQELMARIENQLKIRRMYLTQRELNKTLGLYHDIVSSSSDLMAFIDRELCLVAVNNAILDSFNRDYGEMINCCLDDLSRESMLWQKLKELCLQCLTGEVVSTEFWYNNPVMGKRYVSAVLYPYDVGTGQTEGVVFNARDLTERVEIEREIVNISEHERRSIGIELHDGLSHYLLGIAVQANILSKSLSQRLPQEANTAWQIENQINEAIQKTRNIARGLFPTSIPDGDMIDLFSEIIKGLDTDADSSISLDVDRSVKITDMMTMTQFYSITKEAAVNAVKHAKFRNLVISLKRDGDMIILTIADDGIGISPDKKKKGIGLKIMEYRARMINASIDVRNREPSGTEIICTLSVA